MFSRKYLILISFLFVFAFCKKHEALPDLDQGNAFNPASGKEFTHIDSFSLISGIILKTYPGIDAAWLSQQGVTVKRINVYKNAHPVCTTWVFPGKYYLDNVVSGQKMVFRYSIVDATGRESKIGPSYTITVP